MPAKQADNGDHARQSALGEHVQEGAVSFHRECYALVRDSAWLLQMRPGPKAKRPGLQSGMQGVLPKT